MLFRSNEREASAAPAMLMLWFLSSARLTLILRGDFLPARIQGRIGVDVVAAAVANERPSYEPRKHCDYGN